MSTPQRLSDRYELGDIIGLGGMAEVHLARDLRLHRDVAVKVLRVDLARDPQFQLRFKREAKNAAALNHPAIVAVHDTGDAETSHGLLPYIVMEYVDGVTLRDIVRTDGPLAPRRAIEIIADVCQALNFSHQHGIVHRDVKPANVMISKTGAVKVMDFGIARALSDAGNSLTATATVIGTAQYLSPEQASGETVDARSDVYSLGCVLYELLTGDPPFIGDSPISVAYQHVRVEPTPPSRRQAGISPALDAVVLKSLAKKPDERYQSAAEMRSDLIRVHGGEAPKALGDTPPRATPTGRHAAAPPPRDPHPAADHDTQPATRQPDAPPRRSSTRRWSIVAVALLSVVAVIAAVSITVFGGGKDLRVPDVGGRTEAAAVAELRSRGFETRSQEQTDSNVPSGTVIDTSPAADAEAATGDEIVVNVSSGPPQSQIPDVENLTPEDAESRLRQAGFENLTRTADQSAPELKDRVLSTSPPAGSSTGNTTRVEIVVGSGPDSKPVPDVKRRPAEVAEDILRADGFTSPFRVTVDSPLPAGEVVDTSPSAGQVAAVDSVIQVQVSLANQFVMPDLKNQFWDEAQQRLQSMGWTGGMDRGPDVPGGDAGRARVVAQDPPAGAGVAFGGRVTLSFGS
ncbi:Stk1 family PASTA domain-containing Ser/Thr kinase [Mycolicibacterium sediminis]|uniref:Serine/threonine-protein kinase PknB n=1 Tax=Mycolicibacterium sediminis TaxID=1286180 RepID=A0A7I7QUG8_9MYCO|nr:Stk1 family PASTA domain-containing Ser/Thr kinase [Mycolicibacterium sediminis]BBY29536.1 serine/threonine-protein kinase PknB [Mycolicibacterium sediminis]